jgi:ElaB/YqjD/DUF883 family membrane-anchored ribosome-binding protein
MSENIGSHAESRAGAAAQDASAAGERADIGSFIDDVLEMLSDAREGGQEELVKLRERVRHGARRFKQSAVEGQRQVRAAAGRAAEQADEYAHENPWQVAAIAGAVGLLVGVLISRR